MNFSYDLIETQIIEALPELGPAAEVYADLEGKPGEDSGAYIFFEQMFADYVEVLLAMPASPGRDRLLARAFDLVEAMLPSEDKDVSDLAYIGMFEGGELWFYSRALQFLGPVSRKELDEWEPRWREALTLNSTADPEREIIDLFCAREAVLKELQSEGVDRTQIPGITYPQESQGFPSLADAKHGDDAVVFVSCFGTSLPYVVCPAYSVACAEPSLLKLAQDLAEIEKQEPDQKSKAQVLFLRIPKGERVWNMNRGQERHLRYVGQLWIADIFVRRGLSEKIKEVLDGKREDIS